MIQSCYLFNELIFYDNNPESRIPKHSVSIYEVLKVVEGIPLFAEDHINRLYNSVVLSGNKIKELNDVWLKLIYKFINIAQLNNGRIKFVLFFHSSGYGFYINQIEDIVIPDHLYRTGITIESINIERLNPEAKIIRLDFNKRIDELKKNKKLFEILLVNDEGKVTECSKANIFFIADEALYTPHSKDVLTGITRTHVFQMAEHEHIPVKEKNIFLNELNQFESAFITGTSPGILPIAQIDHFKFNPDHPIIDQLSVSYHHETEKYIKKRLPTDI